MKRVTSASRRSGAKAKATPKRRSTKRNTATTVRRRPIVKRSGPPTTVDEYLARIPEPARSTLGTMRATIRAVLPPEATETISYQMPAYKHNGMLVWFAAFRDHCSLFPTASVIEAFKDDLAGYTTSKGTIQFPIDKPLPTTLIKRLVKARVAQNESKKRR